MPSDGAIAAGPNHVVQAVNSKIEVYSKSGARSLSVLTYRFFGFDSPTFMISPRVLYDAYADRWFILTLGQGGRVAGDLTFAETIFYAYSKTSDPAGQYCLYTGDLRVTEQNVTARGDGWFPGIGMDDYAVYATFERFNAATGGALDTQIRMYPRDRLAGCAKFTASAWTVFDQLAGEKGRPRVLQPAITFGSPGTEYFLATLVGGGGSLVAYGLTGQRSASPQLVPLPAVAVTTYDVPPNAHQKSNSATAAPDLYTGDGRLSGSIVYRDGVLYAAHAAAVFASDSAVVRLYEIEAATMKLIRQTNIAAPRGSGDNYAYPSVMVDAQGTVGVVMALLGASRYPSAAIATRAPGSTSFDVAPFVSGTLPYSCGCPADVTLMWGEYFGIALDPDGRTFWAEATYPVAVTCTLCPTGERSDWATQVVSFSATAATAPSPSPSPSGPPTSPSPSPTPSPSPSPSAAPAMGGRCAVSTGSVGQRVASFWQCVNALGPSDRLVAEDLGQWARNVIEVDPSACISVSDFRVSSAAMQGAMDAASVGIPPAPPKSADVEQRIAAFWSKVDSLGPLDYLAAGDLGQWALNVIDRDPSRQIRVDDFRSSTAGMQAAFDRARAAGAACR